MGVTFATPAPRRNDHPFTRRLQIADQLTGGGVAHNRAHRHLDFAVIAAPPIAVAPHAMLAAPRLVLLLIAQIEQCRQLRIGHGDDVASMSAVAAIGSAPRHELLPAKADAAAPAVTGEDVNFYFIDELHPFAQALSLSFHGQKKSPERGFSFEMAQIY